MGITREGIRHNQRSRMSTRNWIRPLSIAVAILAGIQLPAFAQWVWTPQTGRFINIKRLPKETPELQVEHARSLMLQGDYKKALRETEKFVDFYGDSEAGDENQFLRGEIRLAQGKYQDAANEFQQVIANYPGSELYGQVTAKQYEIGDRYYEQGVKRLAKRWRPFRKGPFKHASDIYTMVIPNQRFSDAAAEAQYKIGLCHFTRKEYVEAAFEYRRVIEDYVTSEWVDEASYGLAMCHYNSAPPPAYDQATSQLAIDAIDEFKVRFRNDARVAELEEKRHEMRERIARQRLKTAVFYENRRQFNAARTYYRVVADGYADTEAAEAAHAWLRENPAPVSRANTVDGI